MKRVVPALFLWALHFRGLRIAEGFGNRVNLVHSPVFHENLPNSFNTRLPWLPLCTENTDELSPLRTQNEAVSLLHCGADSLRDSIMGAACL